MIQAARNSLRSWMFIYAGLIAAVALSGEPADSAKRQQQTSSAPVLIGDAPMGRNDI